MKKNAMIWAVAAVLALGGTMARGDAITGASSPFLVDTRCQEFVIEDVKSAFCHGAYGMVGGHKATFLNGVEAEVEFTVSARGNDVELKRVEVQGKMYEGAKFTLDVGALGVGEIVQVVAYGEMGGAEVVSPPFRVNCDVASVPEGIRGVRVVARHDGAIWYMSDELSTLTILDGIEDGLGLLGLEVPFELKPSFRLLETMDSASGLWKEGTGGGIRLLDLWDGGASLAKLVRTQTIGTIHGIDLELELEGDAVREWNPGRLAWKRHSCSLGIRVAADANITIPIPQTLHLVRLHGGIRTDVKAKFGLDADCELFGMLDWDPVFELYGGVKAGIPGVWADGTGGGGISMKARFPKLGSRHIQELTGVLWLDFKWRMVKYGNWQDPESLHLEWPYSFVGDAKSSSRARRNAPFLKESGWSPIPRNYLPGRMTATTSVMHEGRGALPEAACETGNYPYPAPAVATAGGVDAIAYLRDDGTRADADRTEVVFGENAESVWNDGTADFEPSLAVVGNGTAVLAWANAKQAWRAETPEFAKVCKGLELAVAVRNAGTGAWSARNLTDDEALDASPVVCAAGDGTAMVAWLRNEGGELFGSAESPTAVMASRWDGNAWSAPAELGRGAVSGLDLAYDGTNACVAWAFDGDGDWETAGDGGVSAAVWDGRAWGAAVTAAEGLEGVGPVVAGVDGRGRPSPWCLWGENGKLMERALDGEGATVEAPVVWGGEIPATARAVHGADGALGLAWEDGGRPVVMGYDAGMGMWGGPVAVGEAEAGRMARGVSAAPGASGVLAAWESVAVATNSEGEVAFGDTELRWASVGVSAANPGVAAEGFAFATDEVVVGELTGVQVTVRNTGMKEATNVALRVWVCDGVLEEDEDARWELLGEDGEPVVLDLPGGAEVAATVWWMAEDYRTNLTFVARLEVPDGVEDADGTDNEAMWRPGTAELRLENARCDAAGAAVRLLTATVRNGGLAAAEAGTAVSFRLDSPDGEEIGRDVAGRVLAGEDLGYDAGMTWNMAGGTWTGAWVTVYAVIDTGNAEADASTALPIRVMTPLDRDGDGLLDGEEEAMGTDPLNTDTNGDGVGDWEHVYVFFTDPLAGMDGRWTTNTPVRVPFEWLERFGEALAAHGGDHEAFAADTAANGRPVWACYVADLDPTDAGSQLKMRWEDGEPVYGPKSAGRVYVLEGSEDLTNPAGWCNPTNSRQRFFRVRVQVPQP